MKGWGEVVWFCLMRTFGNVYNFVCNNWSVRGTSGIRGRGQKYFWSSYNENGSPHNKEWPGPKWQCQGGVTLTHGISSRASSGVWWLKRWRTASRFLTSNLTPIRSSQSIEVQILKYLKIWNNSFQIWNYSFQIWN
jgi:hypothetical protein